MFAPPPNPMTAAQAEPGMGQRRMSPFFSRLRQMMQQRRQPPSQGMQRNMGGQMGSRGQPMMPARQTGNNAGNQLGANFGPAGGMSPQRQQQLLQQQAQGFGNRSVNPGSRPAITSEDGYMRGGNAGRDIQQALSQRRPSGMLSDNNLQFHRAMSGAGHTGFGSSRNKGA